MIPYLPSANWYACWVQLQLGRKNDDDFSQLTPRYPNRGEILAPYGLQTLTVPIKGGRRELQRTPWQELRLSEHGNWRHAHWEAITSAYGATPYFHYYSHHFEPIYASPHDSLAELNALLHLRFCRALDLTPLTSWILTHPAKISRQLMDDINPELSALDLLFRYGPETIFHLLSL